MDAAFDRPFTSATNSLSAEVVIERPTINGTSANLANSQTFSVLQSDAWINGNTSGSTFDTFRPAAVKLVPRLATLALVGCDTRRMMDHQVVAVILRRPEELLLCHRSPARRWYPDVWDFPGGHVEPGESPLDALRWEVAEELGVQLEGVDGHPVLHRVDPQRGLDLTVWVSRRWRGMLTGLLNGFAAAPDTARACMSSSASFQLTFEPRAAQPASVAVITYRCDSATVTVGGVPQPALLDPGNALAAIAGRLLGLNGPTA